MVCIQSFLTHVKKSNFSQSFRILIIPLHPLFSFPIFFFLFSFFLASTMKSFLYALWIWRMAKKVHRVRISNIQLRDFSFIIHCTSAILLITYFWRPFYIFLKGNVCWKHLLKTVLNKQVSHTNCLSVSDLFQKSKQ